MTLDKTVPDPAAAIADIPSGSSIAVGGFGLSGNPMLLISAILDAGIDTLSIVSNNCGVDDWGLGVLLAAHRIRKMTSSYVGENKEFERQFFSGELEVELTPQGTLAERLRAGGSGIGGFFTRSGVGTQVESGGLPQLFDGKGGVVKASEPKETHLFDVNGRPELFVLEPAIITDFSIVHASVADTHGNLVFHRSARNFNPLAAMAGRICIVQAEQVVPAGTLDPDSVHLPGVYVHRVVEVGHDIDKPIERRMVRQVGAR